MERSYAEILKLLRLILRTVGICNNMEPDQLLRQTLLARL